MDLSWLTHGKRWFSDDDVQKIRKIAEDFELEKEAAQRASTPPPTTHIVTTTSTNTQLPNSNRFLVSNPAMQQGVLGNWLPSVVDTLQELVDELSAPSSEQMSDDYEDGFNACLALVEAKLEELRGQ